MEIGEIMKSKIRKSIAVISLVLLFVMAVRGAEYEFKLKDQEFKKLQVADAKLLNAVAYFIETGSKMETAIKHREDLIFAMLEYIEKSTIPNDKCIIVDESRYNY